MVKLKESVPAQKGAGGAKVLDGGDNALANHSEAY